MRYLLTTIRSAIICSSASPESYPNTIWSEAWICGHSSSAPDVSASVVNKKCGVTDHGGSSPRSFAFYQHHREQFVRLGRAGPDAALGGATRFFVPPKRGALPSIFLRSGSLDHSQHARP